MYTETTDEGLLRRFYEDESKNTPRWFAESLAVWNQTWEEYLEFSKSCWKVLHIDNRALLFVESVGNGANIHFSILRGQKVDDKMLNTFSQIRDGLLSQCQWVFGWANSRNYKLQRILEAVGFSHNGVTMVRGHSHGRALEWRLFLVQRPKVC